MGKRLQIKKQMKKQTEVHAHIKIVHLNFHSLNRLWIPMQLHVGVQHKIYSGTSDERPPWWQTTRLWHQQEHQGYIKLLCACCILMLGLSSSIIKKHQRLCGCPCCGVIKKMATHTTSHPTERVLCQWKNCVDQVSPRVFRWGSYNSNNNVVSACYSWLSCTEIWAKALSGRQL